MSEPRQTERIVIRNQDLGRGLSPVKLIGFAIAGLAVLVALVALLWNMTMPTGALEGGQGHSLPLESGALQEITALDDGAVTIVAGPNAEQHSQGSGCVLSIQGSTALIATNWHVVQPSNAKTASQWDVVVSQGGSPIGRTIAVRVPSNQVDLAVVEVELNHDAAAKLRVLPMLSPDAPALSPLTDVVVVGSPVGLEHSHTSGQVSAVRDTQNGKQIQIDAAVWPGSSGGPVFSETQEGAYSWAGLVTARSPLGINFAIHVDELREQDYVRFLVVSDGWSAAMSHMNW